MEDDNRSWKGNPELERWLEPIDEIKPNPENARKHGQKSVDAIVSSLAEHGQQTPVLVRPEDRVLLAGEGRWLAARVLGWTHLAALGSDITGAEARLLFSLRDNRTSELSSWDLQLLTEQVVRLNDASVDLQASGLWEDYELSLFSRAVWTPPKLDGDSDDENGSPETGGRSLSLTAKQRLVVDRVIALVRDNRGRGVSEGDCVEQICREYLEGL